MLKKTNTEWLKTFLNSDKVDAILSLLFIGTETTDIHWILTYNRRFNNVNLF